MNANRLLLVRRLGASLTLLAAMATTGDDATAQIGTGVYRSVAGSATREYGNGSLGGSITANAAAVAFDSRIASTYDYARAVVRGAATISLLDHTIDVADASAVATVRGSGNHSAAVRREFFGFATREQSTTRGRVELTDTLTLNSPTYRQDIPLIGPVHIEIRARANLNLTCNVAANVDPALMVASASGYIRTWAGGTASAALSVYVAEGGNGQPLPIDLGIFGWPGCPGHTSGENVQFFVGAYGEATLTTFVPSTATLGTVRTDQLLVDDPTIPRGASVSNAVRTVITTAW